MIKNGKLLKKVDFNTLKQRATGGVIVGATALALILGGGVYWLAGGAEAYSSADANIAQTELGDDDRAWQDIRHSTDVNELNDFIRKFPKSDYVGFAENRLRDLAPGSTFTTASNEESETTKDPSIVGDTALVTSLQKELARVGCKPGRTDGEWGYSGKNALRDFNKYAGTSFDVEAPTEVVIDEIKDKRYRVCPNFTAQPVTQDADNTEETAKADPKGDETVTETVATPTNATADATTKEEVTEETKEVVAEEPKPVVNKKKVKKATVYKKKNYTPRKRKVFRKRKFRKKRRGC